MASFGLRIALLLAALLAAAATPARAATARGEFSLKGLGYKECADFVAAIDLLIRQLAPSRLREQSPLVLVARNGRRVTLPAEILRRVQQRLAGRALYRGPIDGAFSDSLAAAFASYQKAARLPVTEIPDQPTLYELLLKTDSPGATRP